MKDIRELEQKELQEIVQSAGFRSFHASQVSEWLWKKNVRSYDEMSNLPVPLRAHLAEIFRIPSLQLDTSEQSIDGTRKYAFRTHDGLVVEGVLIPSQGRITACISSQVGCTLNCRFCATAAIMNRRDLSTGEIFDQVFMLRDIALNTFGASLSNIVFMGMGEPLLNYYRVTRAIDFMTGQHGLGISPRRVTLSTAGMSEGIRRLARDRVRFNLAVSLHTADPEKRNQIMPVNKSNPLPRLSEAIREFHASTGTRITYEYLLMKDFNDSLEDARQLALFCRICPCKINLIEYNEVDGSPFLRSPPERMQAFSEFLESKNLVVNIRRSRGPDIKAACGQLAGNRSGG